MPVNIGEGEFHGFDLQVHAVRAIDGHTGEIVMFEHPQRHQRRDALAVGRDFMHAMAAI